MISNATVEAINYAKDLDYSNNIKLLLIVSFIVYALIMFWVDREHLKNDDRASMKLMSIAFKIYYIPIFIYIPRFFLLLTRGEDIGFLMLIQTYVYSIGALFSIIIIALYLFERLFKDWLGIEITLKGLKLNKTKIELPTK